VGEGIKQTFSLDGLRKEKHSYIEAHYCDMYAGSRKRNILCTIFGERESG
jgi:hypothetical protein